MADKREIMTFDELLSVPLERPIFLRGEDVQRFCDMMESYIQVNDWDTIRKAAHIYGEPNPLTSMDETQRTMFGQAWGRDWYYAMREGI